MVSSSGTCHCIASLRIVFRAFYFEKLSLGRSHTSSRSFGEHEWPICEWMDRRREYDNQQYLLQLVGTPENLLDIENNLLNSVPSYWTWSSYGTVFRVSLGDRQFKILRNTQQAIKGPNSDPMDEYEYKSVSGSSRSTPSLPSISSKKSGGSERDNR
jgi:hypothetical protein